MRFVKQVFIEVFQFNEIFTVMPLQITSKVSTAEVL